MSVRCSVNEGSGPIAVGFADAPWIILQEGQNVDGIAIGRGIKDISCLVHTFIDHNFATRKQRHDI